MRLDRVPVLRPLLRRLLTPRFCGFLQSIYPAANLASLLVVTPTPFQPIQSISDLANGIFPVCVLDKHVFQHTLIRSYPGVRMIVLNASTGNAAVQALSAPNSPCRAVVAPNVLLQYAMGPVADPNGQYCGLNFAGSPLDFGFYAIPFKCGVPESLSERRAPACPPAPLPSRWSPTLTRRGALEKPRPPPFSLTAPFLLTLPQPEHSWLLGRCDGRAHPQHHGQRQLHGVHSPVRLPSDAAALRTAAGGGGGGGVGGG